MNFAEILVYILAAALALFLILALVLVMLLIKITRQIKDITTTAQKTVNSVEKMAANVSAVTTPAGFARMIQTQVKNLRRKK